MQNLVWITKYSCWIDIESKRSTAAVVSKNMGGKHNFLRVCVYGLCCKCSKCTDSSLAEYPTSNEPIFGVPLIESVRSEKQTAIPKIVVECIEFLEEDDNIELMGIYRVCGLKSTIDEVKRSVMWTTSIAKWFYNIKRFIPFLPPLARFIPVAITMRYDIKR